MRSFRIIYSSMRAMTSTAKMQGDSGSNVQWISCIPIFTREADFEFINPVRELLNRWERMYGSNELQRDNLYHHVLNLAVNSRII